MGLLLVKQATFVNGSCNAFLYLHHLSLLLSLSNLFDLDDAGNQGNSALALCSSPSETIVIMISLPMTKAAFNAIQDKYIASVATAAGVSRENVKILSIDEVSTRSSRFITGRLLLATSVHVQTSVLIPVGQQTSIKDQSVLNSNLNKNGLPSGTLFAQYSYTSAANTTTTPTPGGSGGSGTEAASVSGAATSSNLPIAATVGGGVGGFSALLAITFLAFRYHRRNRTARAPSPSTSVPNLNLNHLY
jgi:hypothetical protein